MTPISLTHAHIESALEHFHRAGRRHRECVVLFIGKRGADKIVVVDVVRPEQRAGRDHFEIPPRSMRRIFDLLRRDRLMVAAQAHTHPLEAFHSRADDRWAIIRHQGALSIVLPHFAKHTSPETFLGDMALFRYSADNRWIEVRAEHVHQHLEVRHE
jgi:sugar phosphate isomerase/epimerase